MLFGFRVVLGFVVRRWLGFVWLDILLFFVFFDGLGFLFLLLFFSYVFFKYVDRYFVGYFFVVLCLGFGFLVFGKRYICGGNFEFVFGNCL